MTITRDDVAKRCGVSPATVSNVMNDVPRVSENIRRKVLKAVDELGYVPNETARKLGMSSKKNVMEPRRVGTLNVGCIMMAGFKYTHSFFSRVLAGVDQELTRQGYHLYFTYSTDELVSNKTLFINMVSSEKVDGVIMIEIDHSEAELLTKVRERVRTVVSVSTSVVDDIDNINVDQEKGAYEAVKHLYELGHRRIAFVGEHEKPADRRFAGYRMAIENFGLKYDSNLVEGKYDHSAGYINTILDRVTPPPTAVVALSDHLAISAINALRARGLRVPEDISIVGFDDIAEAEKTSPPLTTFRVNKEEMGAMGVRRLLERIKNPGLPLAKTILPVEFVVRASCRRIG